MAQSTAPPLIFFTYASSVVAPRIDWYLTLRNIPYYVCRVGSHLPRPVLARLGVHYRRIPLLAAGREIYCDSRCIIEHLERLYPLTTTSPTSPSTSTNHPRLGNDPATHPHEAAMEKILESWAFDSGIFWRTVELIPPAAIESRPEGWVADRKELTGHTIDPDNLRKTQPDGLAHARLHLQWVEHGLLAEGRKWLDGGDSPTLNDIHMGWIFAWITRMLPAYPEELPESKYPCTLAWVKRMEQAVEAAKSRNGAPKELSDDEAIALIESSSLWEPAELEVDETDPTRLKRGDETDLIALDSAPPTSMRRRDVGRLEELTGTRAAAACSTANGVDVRIHYQRANVRVAKASDEERVEASVAAEY